jgi:hypothetical protein
MIFEGKTISRGNAKGKALVSRTPLSFFGGVDPKTGVVIEKGHELEGKSMAGQVLVFPAGKGSTVGSYVMYQLAKNGKAPSAIINAYTETIVACGAIMAGIPCISGIPTEKINTGDSVEIDGNKVKVNE